MTRLTNDLRAIIRDTAVRASFAERNAELARIENALAKEAYEATFGPEIRALVAQVPGAWFRKDACLNFNVGGLRIGLEVSGEGYPVPYQTAGGHGYHCHEEIGVIPAGDLCDRIQAHAKAKEDQRDKSKAAYRGLDALLSSVSSVKKLKEVWPEGEPFYGRFLDEKAPSLPAIRFAEINQALGLASQVSA